MDVELIKGQLHRGSSESAGYDLFAANTDIIVIEPRSQAMIPTGVFTQMRPGVVGIIKDRSGLARDEGITVFGGVIDSDYRKEWGVVLYNSSLVPFYVAGGDRIAQVVFVESLHDIKFSGNSVTTGPDRTSGFGSTGK
jgi:dUTP pyrophosphatase